MTRFFSISKLLTSIILLQLEKHDALHGYALSSTIEQKYNWKPSQTAIYNTLKTLEEKEFVTVQEKIESGRVQKNYSLTEAGKNALEIQRDKMQTQMLKRIAHMMLFVHNFSDTDDLSEKPISDTEHALFEELMTLGSKISYYIVSLHKRCPNSVHQVLTQTLNNLQKLATEQNIEINEPELKKHLFFGD